MYVQILIDGMPLTEVDANWYREQIGVVAQDPRLFSNTIAANITYGCPGKTQVNSSRCFITLTVTTLAVLCLCLSIQTALLCLCLSTQRLSCVSVYVLQLEGRFILVNVRYTAAAVSTIAVTESGSWNFERSSSYVDV